MLEFKKNEEKKLVKFGGITREQLMFYDNLALEEVEKLCENKLKELRVAHSMTQEAVAEHLGVSSQTVSKWERGLLYPDITLLPKIALLFKCSIDSLFDMDLLWSIEHRKEFGEKIQALHEQKDWEGVYQAWIREIELNPDHYGNYADVMLHVYRKKLYDKDRVEKMISLAEHAEKCCTDDDKRNEIYRIMLQLCSESKDPSIREKGKYYYVVEPDNLNWMYSAKLKDLIGR